MLSNSSLVGGVSWGKARSQDISRSGIAQYGNSQKAKMERLFGGGRLWALDWK
jgi:hypothetical protein